MFELRGGRLSEVVGALDGSSGIAGLLGEDSTKLTRGAAFRHEGGVAVMNHKERVLSALSREGYDRIPVRYQAMPEIDQQLMGYLGVADRAELLECLGDDVRFVTPSWNGPGIRTLWWEIGMPTDEDGTWQGWWGERLKWVPFGGGSYPEVVHCPFADVTRVSELDSFRLPTADWFDYSSVRRECETYADYAVVFGGGGYMNFINGTARCRGVEQVLIDIATEDPVFLALTEQRYALFYEMTERVLQAAGGLVDIVFVGDDLGQQTGLMISPGTFERLFARKYEEFFRMVHRYGARTMMHSCGSVRQLIPRLMEIGLDILEAVEVSAARMGISRLKEDFGEGLCFCGSMDVKTFLPRGTEQDVCREVELRKKLFSRGGLILGPSHTIQAGTPVDNILAMYKYAGSLSGDAAYDVQRSE